MKNKKCLLFDLGGVLVDLDRAACEQSFLELGVQSPDLLLPTAYSITPAFADFERGRIGEESFFDQIRHVTGLNISDDQIRLAWNSFLSDLPLRKLQLLRQLRDRYRICLVSNTNSIHWNYTVRQWFEKRQISVGDCFDRLFLSYEMGVVKPDSAYFRYVLDDLGVDPTETIFFDDSEANIETALTMGFNTCRIIRPDQFESLLSNALNHFQ